MLYVLIAIPICIGLWIWFGTNLVEEVNGLSVTVLLLSIALTVWVIGGSLNYLIESSVKNYKYDYIVYNNGEINIVNYPTEYIFGKQTRTNCWNPFDEDITEYRLKTKDTIIISCTKDINKIFDYFEPNEKVITRK